MADDFSNLKHAFEQHGQGHVFRFWDTLSDKEQAALLGDLRQIDLEELDDLIANLVKSGEGHGVDVSDLEPPPYEPLPDKGGNLARWNEAFQKGEEALRAGRVVCFTVAGGQGTRLGYDGPKGTFPVTPVRDKTLFHVFADRVLAGSRRYGKPIHWFIMTSQINHEATRIHFEENGFFGLDREQVHFFSQGLMPAVTPEGKIILAGKHQVAMTPDGHGGSLRALVRSGAVEKMEAIGADILSYFQVDNPLYNFLDPQFIGFHVLGQSELASKMIPKAYAGEKVGHFCKQRGKMVVIEYSDLPKELAEALDDAGELKYRAGSVALHCFDREFVRKMGSGEDASCKLPFHRADKKIPCVDEDGNLQKPDKPNGIKFEMFVFDALPFAKNPVIVEGRREDDFSPVKNAEGTDSPQTCRDDQLRQHARWLIAAGETPEIDETGKPSFALEISPTYAMDLEAFVKKWQGLEEKPELTDGLYLE